MIYMQSSSASDGTYTLTVTFKIGTDLNFAQVLVQNRVSSALAQLPQAVQNQGVTVQKQSTAILMFVTLTSPDRRYDSLFLANYATIRLKDELARLPGVGNVACLRRRPIFDADLARSGQAEGARPDAAGRHLGAAAAEPAGHRRADRHAAGAGRPGVSSTRSTSPGRLADAAQFENVIVKTGDNGDVTRVRDVGRVELGAQTYGQIFKLNGRPAAGIAVFQSPGANALDVAERRQRQDGGAGESLSAGHDVRRFRSTPRCSSSESIKEVYKTLIEAALLVLDRDPDLPAGLARDAGAGDDRAGDDHRRVRRDGGARLLGQPLDPVRDRAGDRHRGRRRHRRRRRRGASDREGHRPPRRRHPGDERIVRRRSSASRWC